MVKVRNIILFFVQAYLIDKSIQRSTTSGCYLDIANNTNGAAMPVIVNLNTRKLELVIPKNGAVQLKRGEAVTFSCPGTKNYLENVEAKEITGHCEGKNELKVGNKFLEFEDVKCVKSVHATVKNLNSRCGGKANLLMIGYSLDGIDEFLPLINVCYSQAHGKTLFTEHLLHGEEIKYASKSGRRPSFSTEGLPSNVISSTGYNRKYQKATFSSLLGSSTLAERFINDTSYFATGHLSPYADFIYTSSQRSSNFYINACPQWQTINNGNWKSVELLVRKTGQAYNRTFQIITGTHDILKLPNNHDNLVEITLQRGKLPVPKYIWKIMYDYENRKAIAFVVLNNPFDNVYDKPEFCRNICNIYDWGKPQWNDFSKGYVFCCEIKELRKVVTVVPNISVNGVIQGV